MWSKSSMTLFSVISMTVWPRSAAGVASTNSCTKLSPRECKNRSSGSVLMKRRQSGGQGRAAARRHDAAEAVELGDAALVARDLEERVGPVQLALHAGRAASSS